MDTTARLNVTAVVTAVFASIETELAQPHLARAAERLGAEADYRIELLGRLRAELITQASRIGGELAFSSEQPVGYNQGQPFHLSTIARTVGEIGETKAALDRDIATLAILVRAAAKTASSDNAIVQGWVDQLWAGLSGQPV